GSATTRRAAPSPTRARSCMQSAHHRPGAASTGGATRERSAGARISARLFTGRLGTSRILFAMAGTPDFAHASAYIAAAADIGAGRKIWHFCHVSPGAKIGPRCVLGQNVYVGNVTVGENCRIQNNVSLYDGVKLEDHVFCGPSMVFTNVINPRAEVNRKAEFL